MTSDLVSVPNIGRFLFSNYRAECTVSENDLLTTVYRQRIINKKYLLYIGRNLNNGDLNLPWENSHNNIHGPKTIRNNLKIMANAKQSFPLSITKILTES